MNNEIITQEVQVDINNAVHFAKALEVTDGKTYESAVSVVKVLQDKLKSIETIFKPHIERAHQQHKLLIAESKVHTMPIQVALDGVKYSMNQWTTQERKRVAEVERIKQAKLQAEAEERRLAEAAEMETIAPLMGLDAAETQQSVTQILNQPLHVPKAKAETFIPKMQDVQTRTNWKFEITDASLVPREYLIVDEKAVGAMVRARKGDTKIPGVRVYSETSTVVM